jgi:hypothetical protein
MSADRRAARSYSDSAMPPNWWFVVTACTLCLRAPRRAVLGRAAWQVRVAQGGRPRRFRARSPRPWHYEPGGRRFESCRAHHFLQHHVFRQDGRACARREHQRIWAWRGRIVPSGLTVSVPPGTTAGGAPAPVTPGPRRNPLWAELMQRTFRIHVLACPRCGGHLQLIALIEDRRVIRRMLGHLGLATLVKGQFRGSRGL